MGHSGRNIGYGERFICNCGWELIRTPEMSGVEYGFKTWTHQFNPTWTMAEIDAAWQRTSWAQASPGDKGV